LLLNMCFTVISLYRLLAVLSFCCSYVDVACSGCTGVSKYNI
jgi:hypothetical protein